MLETSEIPYQPEAKPPSSAAARHSNHTGTAEQGCGGLSGNG